MKMLVLDNLKLNKYHLNILKNENISLTTSHKECDVVLIRNTTTIDKKFLEEHPKLKYVVRAGVGLDNIDVELCKSKGIEIINAPGSNAFSVAELFFFHALNALRHTCKAGYELKKTHDFSIRKKYVGNNIKNKTIGIIGTGHIGKEIIKRLTHWEVNILCYDIVQNEDLIRKYGVRYTTLENLIKNSHIIALCVPLTQSTEKMINKNLLSKAQNKPIIINLSRGKIVDEKHIIELLNKGVIAYYASDVIYNEEHPEKEDLEIINHEKTFITPHIGSNTYEALNEMITQALHNFIEKIKQKPAHLNL